MSVETSSAPKLIWASPWGGWQGNRGMIACEDREHWYQFGKPLPDHEPTAYVRRDLVVPTVDELAEAGQRMFGWDLVHAAHFAELTHRLLSRIEGDNDEQ